MSSRSSTDIGGKVWHCDDCGYVRERKSDIVRHIERKHIDMQVACEYCETLFANRYALKNHLKSKHYV